MKNRYSIENSVYRKNSEMLGRLRKFFSGRENIKTAEKNSSVCLKKSTKLCINKSTYKQKLKSEIIEIFFSWTKNFENLFLLQYILLLFIVYIFFEKRSKKKWERKY